MSPSDSSFDANDYRKRVLAVIEARGGVPASDPFEWYDLPLPGELGGEVRDSVVAAQVDAVWAFWQKSRDSPKYRGLVTALLDAHRETGPLVLDRASRRALAEQVRLLRRERDEDRFAELDGAVARLVERFGGVPRSKLEGLRAFGAQAGLDAADVAARLARTRVLETREAPATLSVPPDVRRQVRADLDELGRLLGTPPPATLYDLLGLPPGAARDEVERERAAALARNRELRPDRRRALVDDLLAAVGRLLVEGDPDAYLDAVAEDVTARLRPRLAAALLVEDVLTADDHAHLLAEAQDAGLDPRRAAQVLAALAGEAGVPLPAGTTARSRPERRTSPAPAPAPDLPELDAARAALRAGRVREAQQLVEAAHRRAGRAVPALQAVADEVAAVQAEARTAWRVVEQALAARRFTEAAGALDRLVRTAVDVDGPRGLTAAEALRQARAGLEAAADRLAAAEALHGPARDAALLAAVAEFPDSEGLLAAVRALAVAPARDVHAERGPGGVVVRWQRSGTPDVDYRVVRIGADGSRRVLGSTRGTQLEDGEPPTAGVPTYAVTARRAGVSSAEVVTGAAAAAAAPDPGPAPGPAPVPALWAAPHRNRVRLVFPPPATGRAEVRRLPPGARPPSPGSAVPPDLGTPLSGMGPGLALDARTDSAAYVVVTVEGGRAVAGASVVVADLPAVTRLRVEDGRLRWEWPPGCTEALVVWRADAPPEGAGDPRAERRKTTNTRYDLDGGTPVPDAPHVAVFPCARVDGELAVALDGTRLVRGTSGTDPRR